MKITIFAPSENKYDRESLIRNNKTEFLNSFHIVVCVDGERLKSRLTEWIYKRRVARDEI